MAGSSENLGSNAFVTFSSVATPENLSGSGSFGIPSLGGITQNVLGSSSFGIGSSSGPQINSALGNQSGLNGSEILSFSGQYSGAPQKNYFQSNGSRIESTSGPFIGGTSLGLGASLIWSPSGPNINRASVGLSVSGTRLNNFFGSNGSENGSSLANWQNDSASDNWEINYGPSGIRMGPSLVAQQNQNNNLYMEASSRNNYVSSGSQSTLVTQQTNVPIIGDTFESRLGSQGIRFESSPIRRQNIRPRRGRPSQTRPTSSRLGTVSSSQDRWITRSSRDRGTSVNRSCSGPVVSEPVSNRHLIRVVERFVGDKRLSSKLAEAEDWTTEEKAIVEEALKVPCSLPKQVWLASISGLLETKTMVDVAVLLNYFMEERSAKRIKVDLNVTTDNDRTEHVPDPSASSSRLTGSFGIHAQDTTASNQGFPPQLTAQETTNVAPPQPQLGINEELGNSVASPTFDPDMLLDLSYSPERILEDLEHLKLPPETNPDEGGNRDRASGHGNS